MLLVTLLSVLELFEVELPPVAVAFPPVADELELEFALESFELLFEFELLFSL
jgi:hypothetical protein